MKIPQRDANEKGLFGDLNRQKGAEKVHLKKIKNKIDEKTLKRSI